MPFQKDDVQHDAVAADLRQIALFENVADADLARIVGLGEPVDAEPGAVLIDQGDVGTEVFLVIDGEAGIYSGNEHVATISAGAVVGEMALVGHRPRNATVRAQSPMRLLSFDIAAFKRLLDEMPAARDHIFRLLEARAAENRAR